MKKSICIITFSQVARDARVLRQIKYLSRQYDLTVVGYGRPHPAWASKQNIWWIPVEPRSNVVTKLTDLVVLTLGRIRSDVYDRWYQKKQH